jgi:hypothetical protein
VCHEPKSSVAEEIAYLLEQRGEPYALLDLDYLSWAGTGTDDRAAEFGLMLQNLASVAANYRQAAGRGPEGPRGGWEGANGAARWWQWARGAEGAGWSDPRRAVERVRRAAFVRLASVLAEGWRRG